MTWLGEVSQLYELRRSVPGWTARLGLALDLRLGV